MQIKTRRFSPFLALSLVATISILASAVAQADRVTLRIATGHPPGVVYAGLMKDYFQPELKRRIEARTEHTVNFIEGYRGYIVKNS